MEKIWTRSLEEIEHHLKADLKKGLKEADAQNRLSLLGKNVLPAPKTVSPYRLFLHQFSSFVIWLLLGAVVVSAALGQWTEALSILAIVVLNAILGFFQEFRAQKSIEALKSLFLPSCKVLRDGHPKTILSEELVVGDLVLLEAGDRVPADGRIIYSAQLSLQESALTGESIPVHKSPKVLSSESLSLGDRLNMAYMGTAVANGKGTMVVAATGVHTEMGKIALLLQESKAEETPLQKRLEKLGRHLALVCLGIVLIVFLEGLIRKSPLLDMILVSLSLAVAAVPEGLPAVVTISLAIGVRRMAKRQCLVRRLSSVETLGSVAVICSDKTGTLTQNEMQVRMLWVDGKTFTREGMTKPHLSLHAEPSLVQMLKMGALCNNASLKNGKAIGDPTEVALLEVAEEVGLHKDALVAEEPVIGELPFDSDRKMMSVLCDTKEGPILYVKGALDLLLQKTDHIATNGGVKPLSEEQKRSLEEVNRTFAREGLRVIAFAFRRGEELREEQLTFLGLVAMSDPPRPEVFEALKVCKEAQIRTIMITGDHKDTAVAIAKELHILGPDQMAITGQELEELDDAAFADLIHKIVVYARVSPYHKLRIVEMWKKTGQVIAMTGDGVNDALAIKEADIGLAMGITGTDVAKEASDMVIADDNFASIVHGVEEGRGIFDNITKFVTYLLSGNVAEILIIFISILFPFLDAQGNPLILLLPVQLLWINFVTDGFPAIALALDPISPHVMERPPNPPHQPLLSRMTIRSIAIRSLLITVAVLFAGYMGYQQSPQMAQTMAFTTLVFLELIKVHIVRTQFGLTFFSNPWMVAAIGSSLFLQLLVVYIPPLQPIFGTVAMGLREWGLLLLLGAAFWLGNKIFLRRQYYKRDGSC